VSMRQGLVAGLVIVLLPGVSVAVGSAADAATTGVRVTRWVDGDTVETTRGTVRLIGIDTPERGRCGYEAATRHAQSIAPEGSRIRLGNPQSVVDRDRYGRILRYVLTTVGRDVGLAQIKNGAQARYDSRDGHQRHPRQAGYHRSDSRHPGYRCAAPPTSGGGQPPTSDGDCPGTAPLKGNQSSMIYHSPGQTYYDVTRAEVCFATPAQAEAAGYRAARI
jgi:micrococcal nuclease